MKYILKISCIIIAFCLCPRAFAQQTIINVTSSDVLPLGHIILKESNRFCPFTPDQFVTLTPTVVVGTGNGTEISAGVGTTLDGEASVRGNFSAKKVWFLGSATRLTTGATVNPFLNTRQNPNTLAFAHLSYKIKETKTSLTAGGYVAGQNSMPNYGGVLFGIDQVIIPTKLRLVADWMSGEQSQGRFAVGFKYRPKSTVSITTAVIIPNKVEDNNIGFNVSVSKFLSIDGLNSKKRRL